MTFRDEIREARNQIYLRAMRDGVNMDAERGKTGTTTRTLSYQATKLINDNVPRIDREQMVVEDPPTVGTFDGVNTAFTLGQAPKGLNIHVTWHSTAENTAWPLTRTNGNPPGNHSFYFNPADPTNFIVGNPPLAGDRLIVTYLAER